MVKLVILIRKAAEDGDLERRYQRNLDLLHKMPGVQRVQSGEVFGSPAGDAPYERIVEVHFPSRSALDSALKSPEGVAAGKDLIDYTGAAVEMFFAEEQAQSATKPLSPQNLRAYLENQQIEAEIVSPGQPTPTVPAAAKALGVDESQIVKTVIFLVDGRPFAVYACGTRRVDPRKLAQRLRVSRKHVRLAEAEQVLALTGYAVGTVPPVGLKTPMPAFIDPAVLEHEVIYAGGGGVNALLKMRSAELKRVTGAEVLSVLRENAADSSEPQNAK